MRLAEYYARHGYPQQWCKKKSQEFLHVPTPCTESVAAAELACEFNRCAVHDTVKIHRRDGTIFQGIALAHVRVSIFQNTLHHHAIKTSMTHDSVIVFL